MTYLTAAHVCRETCRPAKLSTTHTLHDIRKDLVIIEAVKELGGTPKDEQMLIWQEVMKHRTSGAACCQASSPEATNPMQKCRAKSYKLLTTTTMTVPSAHRHRTPTFSGGQKVNFIDFLSHPISNAFLDMFPSIFCYDAGVVAGALAIAAEGSVGDPSFVLKPLQMVGALFSSALG
jgi:hypothetical protein